jgi:hypothetical protein
MEGKVMYWLVFGIIVENRNLIIIGADMEKIRFQADKQIKNLLKISVFLIQIFFI